MCYDIETLHHRSLRFFYRIYRTVFCVFIFYHLAPQAHAQLDHPSGAVTGYVLDTLGNPLVFANVSIGVGSNITSGTTTDSTGYFYIDRLRPDYLWIQANSTNFKTTLKQVFEVRTNCVTQLVFRLEPGAGQITETIDTVLNVQDSISLKPVTSLKSNQVSIRSMTKSEIESRTKRFQPTENIRLGRFPVNASYIYQDGVKVKNQPPLEKE